MSDQAAFQEVDDAVRQDDLKAWWARYGTWMVGGVVVLVVVVAALVGWRQYQASRGAAASAAYSASMAKIGKDDTAARNELDEQAKNAPAPYRALAALAAAQLRGSDEQNVAALLAVAPELPSELSDLALVMAGFRGVDTPKAGELLGRLEPLAGPERAFRVSVRELQALAAAHKGDTKSARAAWEEIAKDRAAPPGAQQRAQAMLNLYAAGEAK